MNRPASLFRRYRITIRGDCGGTLASVVANAQAGVPPERGDWLPSGAP